MFLTSYVNDLLKVQKNNNMKDRYFLKEIANWQLDRVNSRVELPNLQRGFVWKPKQIEDLWDSILREYPIGSFLFSKTDSKFSLLDGQQRATAIFLGYYNPFETVKSPNTWSIKSQLPVVWLDVELQNKPKLSLYAFRVITNSHPWGYQISNNDVKLTEADRREAIKIFRLHPNNAKIGYTKFVNTTVFPYACSYPVPLSFLLEADSAVDVIKLVEKYIPEYIKTKRGGFNNKQEFIEILKGDLFNNLETLFNQIQKIKSRNIHADIVEDKVLQQENEEDNPTLFQRINSSGTTLSADDLIYSIYKTIFPETKEIVEKMDLKFISPVQLISIATRIALSDISDDKFVKKLGIKDFQNRVREDVFRNKLRELILGDRLKNTVVLALDILSCKNNKEFDGEVPPVVIKSLIKRNQDLFLLLLYWLYKNEGALTIYTKFEIARKIFLFHIFNFDNIQKLWIDVMKTSNFWKYRVDKYIWWDDVDGINFIIPPQLLKAFYKLPEVLERFKNQTPDRWGLLESDSSIQLFFDTIKKPKDDLNHSNKYFENFIGNIRGNRLLVIMAQRQYINDNFIDFNQLEDFDDTNSPWDWDHIYPSDWVHSKSNINKGIRDWNNTNGNLRVLSLDQNRSESNSLSPKLRLESKRNKEISFVQDSDYQYWCEVDSRIYGNDIQNHFYAITNRMINIYKKFWDDFKIQELIYAI